MCLSDGHFVQIPHGPVQNDDHWEDAPHFINFVAYFINEYSRIFDIRSMVTIRQLVVALKRFSTKNEGIRFRIIFKKCKASY